ncbi:hypothetical protein, partial [Paraburkholderia sp. J76]|uniref:hypothetical protein n=1 Tax=Paraburkholderia sp. J76 TaxID=2805439 RepID=UPI002ABDC770
IPRLSAQCSETGMRLAVLRLSANAASLKALRKTFDWHSAAYVCYRIEGPTAIGQLYDTKPKI